MLQPRLAAKLRALRVGFMLAVRQVRGFKSFQRRSGVMITGSARHRIASKIRCQSKKEPGRIAGPRFLASPPAQTGALRAKD